MAKWQDDVRDLDWSVFSHPGERFRGTRGNDRLVGTDLADIFNIRQGGRDHVRAEGGRDTIYAGASLTADDRINGGGSFDTLVLEGDYSSGLELQSNTISRVENLILAEGFNYSITMAPDMRHDKFYFSVDAVEAQSLYIDGSAMDFSLIVTGSGGDDILTGGTDMDALGGGAGHDVLTGGAGAENFGFYATSDSLPSNPDVITDFDGDDGDFINLASIDGDTQKPGDQDLHFGATPGRTGDITFTYDAGQNVTFVNVFTDSDANPDMVIQLLGDHSDLTSADFFL